MKLNPPRSRARSCVSIAAAGLLALVFSAAAPTRTQTAVANGDTRTIYLHHSHTGESIAATFRVDGQYDRATLDKLNHFLRDWRNDNQTTMNPRLFDVIWETYRESGSRQPITIVSAYRSPETNAMLRRRSRAVAEHSQHILGKAMDMHYADVPMSKVREIAMRLQRGGVGYYPTAGTPFVHLDVGSVRAWPRMSYDQLVRLFPDGKTVHLPTNGHPLARYEEARAEIESRGGAPVMVASALPKSGGRGFFSRLFGIGEDDEDTGAVATPRGRTRIARATTADKDDAGAIQTPSERRAAEQLARAGRNLPRGETTMGAPGGAVVPVQVAAVSILPPPRPASLGAPLADPTVAFANVPLPPVRPSALVSVASAEKNVAPPLPDVIRQGAEPAIGALAYAPQDGIALRGPVLTPVAQQRAAAPRRTQLYAARLDQTNYTLMTQPAPLSGAMAQKDLGMRPGLRASVKAEGRAVALQGVLLSEDPFSPRYAELRTDRFTGAAVRTAGLSPALFGELR